MSTIFYNFCYNLDRAAASLFGAPPQETISSELGRHPKGRVAHVVITILNDIQSGHVERAVLLADKLGKLDT